jgi:hypothetical protein
MTKIQKKSNGDFVFIVDETAAKKAGFDEKSEFDVSIQDNKIIIEKKGKSLSEKNFEKVIDQYGEVFKKLSKT